MTDSYRLATNKIKIKLANTLATVANNSGANSGLYVFIGAPNPYTGSDANVYIPDDSWSQAVNCYNVMVCGKKVTGGGSKLMASRYDWAANTYFAQYLDNDSEIFSKNFFSVVNASSFYHVFKVLDNNANGASTVPPTFSDTSASDTFYQTADGYQWKYMYTISKEDWDSFSTNDFIPLTPNTSVSGNAVSGAIDNIQVTSGGAYYSNFYEGQWNASDIQIGGNTVLYAIGNTAVSTNGYYTNCIITIIEGTGKGQYREITGYSVISLTKEIVVNGAFTTIPDSTSQYAISPKINVIGDGKQSSNVVARALINAASSNAVYKIEILSRGVGYRDGTANVCPNPYVPISNVAVLNLIIPPRGGHGYNAAEELGATSIGFSVKLSNTESNTISSDNDYRQVGLILDPLWSNVSIDTLNTGGTSGSNGTFLVGERILEANPIFLSGNVSVNTTSAVVTGTNTSFANVFSAGSYVMIKAGSSYFLSTVNAVTNATYMTLASNCSFLNAAANIAFVNVYASGYATNVASGTLRLTNVAGNVVVGGYLIGVNTYSIATVNSYAINGMVKGFSTFNQRFVYQGTLTSGTFVEDEAVFQSSGGANVGTGFFHAIDTIGANTKVYLVDETGVFSSTGTITGANSGAVFTISAKYPGDFVVDSGDILYLENITPVSRANNQSEVIKIILEL